MSNVDWDGLLGSQAELLPDLSPLTADQEQRLYRLAQETITREQAALDRALDEALSFVPRLLRGPVKKLVLR